MTKKLVLVHTVPSLVGVFTELCGEILPADVEVRHIADEVLLMDLLAHDGITPFIHRHFAHHVVEAQEFGADVVLLSCSSIAPCVESARPLVSIPVLRVDEAMVDRALDMGGRIGVLATVGTTLKPSTELLRACAEELGTDVQVEAVLCDPQAYEAVLSGDVATHDRIVRETLLELMSRSDVVLLAQVSTARVLDTLKPEEKTVPVLTSPRLALERVREMLERQALQNSFAEL